ncbi:MAG: hypothetical protein IJZ38_12970 [Bacteroides sp.]|nr:hypothetical protein [Bacteroides sp.]
MNRGTEHEIRVLNQLHQSCIFTSSSYTGPIPKSFSEQIRSDIEEIDQLGLNQNISDWGTRCQTERKKMNFTLLEVASRLEVTHRALQKQEKNNTATTVDLFYLEAFSLLYQVSPYILLGKKEPHLPTPMTFLNRKITQYHCFIMEHLYVYNDDDKLKHLELITKIAKLTPEKYECLVSFLVNTKTFFDITKKDPTEYIETQNPFYFFISTKPKLAASQRDTKEFWKRKVYWDAKCVLDDIVNREPERLQVLANLAACNKAAVAQLLYILTQIGFPRDHKSFRTYHCEEMFIEPSDGQTLPSYGRGSYRHKTSDESSRKNASDTTTKIKSSDSTLGPKCAEQKNPINHTQTGENDDFVYDFFQDDPYHGRTQNRSPQQAFLYCPSRHSGSPYQIDSPDFAVTIIYGNDEDLTAFLRTLTYIPHSSDDAPQPSESTSPIEYRIELGMRRVLSRYGTAELNEEEVDIISWYIDDIEIKSPISDSAPDKTSN